MKIQVAVREFLEAFRLAAAAAPKSSAKPILQNVKLTTTGEGVVTLTGTDLETGVIANVDATVSRSGPALLPAQRMRDILVATDSSTLDIELDAKGLLTITGERSRYTLPTENASDFPAVAAFTDERYYEVRGSRLASLIRRTAFATNEESQRNALGGVLLEMNGHTITAVATDGRRLAKMEADTVDVGGCPTPTGQTIVPPKVFSVLGDLQPDDCVQIAVRANDILIRAPRATIYSRLIEGRFPDWRNVMPQKLDTRIELPVGALAAAVRQAAICTSGESRGVEFSFAAGMLVLSAEAADVGKTHIELPISDCGTVTITLDPHFVVDFLKVLDPDTTAIFSMNDAEHAALFSTDDGFCYVVMPLSKK
jgi:DNA polymerase III subunit beta